MLTPWLTPAVADAVRGRPTRSTRPRARPRRTGSERAPDTPQLRGAATPASRFRGELATPLLHGAEQRGGGGDAECGGGEGEGEGEVITLYAITDRQDPRVWSGRALWAFTSVAVPCVVNIVAEYAFWECLAVAAGTISALA